MPALRDHEYRTLISPAGRFIFSKEVSLSQAKLIRDTVTAQCLRRDPALPAIRTSDDAKRHVFSHVAGPTSLVNFTVELNR
jgi:hypothetical protein